VGLYITPRCFYLNSIYEINATLDKLHHPYKRVLNSKKILKPGYDSNLVKIFYKEIKGGEEK